MNDLQHKLNLLVSPSVLPYGKNQVKQARARGISNFFSKWFRGADDVADGGKRVEAPGEPITNAAEVANKSENMTFVQGLKDRAVNTRLGRSTIETTTDASGNKVRNIRYKNPYASGKTPKDSTGKMLDTVDPKYSFGNNPAQRVDTLRTLKPTDTGSTLKNLYGKGHNTVTGGIDRLKQLGRVPEELRYLTNRTIGGSKHNPTGLRESLKGMAGKGAFDPKGNLSLIRTYLGDGPLANITRGIAYPLKAITNSGKNFLGGTLNTKTGIAAGGYLYANDKFNEGLNTGQGQLAQLGKAYNQLQDSVKGVAQQNAQLQQQLEQATVPEGSVNIGRGGNALLGTLAGGGIGLGGIYLARRMAIKRYAEENNISEEEAESELARSGQLTSYMGAMIPALGLGTYGYFK